MQSTGENLVQRLEYATSTTPHRRAWFTRAHLRLAACFAVAHLVIGTALVLALGTLPPSATVLSIALFPIGNFFDHRLPVYWPLLAVLNSALVAGVGTFCVACIVELFRRNAKSPASIVAVIAGIVAGVLLTAGIISAFKIDDAELGAVFAAMFCIAAAAPFVITTAIARTVSLRYSPRHGHRSSETVGKGVLDFDDVFDGRNDRR